MAKDAPVAYKECPIFDLPEFVTEHWDMDTLCAEFNCIECLLPDVFAGEQCVSRSAARTR